MWNSGTGDDTFIVTKHAGFAIKRSTKASQSAA
jgi:hypothetical protein